MQVMTGTSGFSIDEWQGKFYPKGLRVDDRLGFYALRLHSVEINNTFYQMPKVPLFERWRDAVPDDFRFALKAPRRFTHTRPLKAEGESLHHFLASAAVLGSKLGPTLFQLPPFVRKDTGLLAEFLAKLPTSTCFAFEFRHRSWFDDEVFALLTSKNVALCGGDSDERGFSPPLVATADFGYLRLRAAAYDANGLRDWGSRILAQPWAHAYVYLKHEVLGPDYAMFLAAVTAGAIEPALPSLSSEATPNRLEPEYPRAVEPAQSPVPSRPKKGLARARPRKESDVAREAPRPARRRRAV